MALSEAARILLVEDDPHSLKVMRVALESAHFQVDCYSRASEVLENFKPGAYDLLLIDIKLPDISGFDLYEKLRMIELALRVCFVTAFSAEYYATFKRLYAHLDLTCFIEKPGLIEDFIAIVKKHVHPTNGNNHVAAA